MDNNLSDLLGGVLSNPEMMNKVMTLLPVVSQMMNSGNSNNANQNQGSAIETTAVNPPNTSAPTAPTASNEPNRTQSAQSTQSVQSAESLMADANVISALQNLVAALNSAQTQPQPEPAPPEIKPDAVMASAFPSMDSNMSAISSLANMLGSSAKQDGGAANSQNNGANNIEKTLDTLKNISSATSPDSDHRAKLLLALKPFLKDARQTKIDTAIKYMSAAKLFTMFGKNGFV